MPKKKLFWKTIQKRVFELVPQDINPRTISDKQLSDLKKSIKKYNLVEIPVIDFDNTLLAGHQRYLAMKILGREDELIDVRVPNRKLTEKEAQQYLIASNKLGGDWDYDLLKHFDLEILSDAGFDDMELVSFWDKENESVDDDFDTEKEIKKIHNPTTERGDLKSKIEKLKESLRSTESRADKWLELTEKTFHFACYARAEFMKKDIKKNREIVNALGLNFSLKDKELKINKADWFIPIEKAYPELKAEFKRLELDKSLGNKGKSEAFASLILNWGDYRESNPDCRYHKPE